MDSTDNVSSTIKKTDRYLLAWKTLAILSSIATLVMYTETMLVPSLSKYHKRIWSLLQPFSLDPYDLPLVGAVTTGPQQSGRNLRKEEKRYCL